MISDAVDGLIASSCTPCCCSKFFTWRNLLSRSSAARSLIRVIAARTAASSVRMADELVAAERCAFADAAKCCFSMVRRCCEKANERGQGAGQLAVVHKAAAAQRSNFCSA